MLSRISAFLRVWVQTWVPIADLPRKRHSATFIVLTILVVSIAVLVVWCASMALLFQFAAPPD
jgi:hypothetical protein